MVHFLVKDGRFCHVLDLLCQVMASSGVDEAAGRTHSVQHCEEEERQAAWLALKEELDAFFLFALSHIRQTCSTATLLCVVKAFLGMEMRYLREKMRQAPHAIPETASSPLSALVDHSHFFEQREEEMVEHHGNGEKVDQKDVQTLHENHKGDEANERGRKRWQYPSPEEVWKGIAKTVWGMERSAKKDTTTESRPSSSPSSSQSFASYGCFSSFVASEVLPHFSFLPYDVETLFCSSPLVGNANAPHVWQKSRAGDGGHTGGSQPPSNEEATTTTKGQEGDDAGKGVGNESKKESDKRTETTHAVREVENTFSTTAASLTPSDVEAKALFHLLLLNGHTVVEAASSPAPSRKDDKVEVEELRPDGVETEKKGEVEDTRKEEKKMGCVHGWSMTDTVVETYRRSLAGPLQRLGVFYRLLSHFHRIRLERESLLTSSAVGTTHASTCRYPRQKEFFFHDTALLLPIGLVQRILVTTYPFLSPVRNVLVMRENGAETKEMKGEDAEAPPPLVSSLSSFSDASVDVFSFLRICNHYHNAEIQHHCHAPSSRSSFDTDACDWKEHHWGGGGKQEKKKEMAPLSESGAGHRASLSISEVTRPWREEKAAPTGGNQKKEGETGRGTHSGRTAGREQVGCSAAAVLLLCPARTPWIAVETRTQPNETKTATKASGKCHGGSAAESDSNDLDGIAAKQPFEEDHKGVAQSSEVSTVTTTIESRSVVTESSRNPTPSSSTLSSGVDGEKNTIKGPKVEDPAVALMRRRIKNERVDLIQRASNAYYYDQLLHRQDGASSRSSSRHSSSRTNSPDGGRSHSSVSSGVGSGGSGVRPFYERLFDGDQFEKYAGLSSSSSSSCSGSFYSGTTASSSYMGDARNTLQSIWNDMSIGVDVLVMLFSGAAIGYFLGALRGASEGERLLYMVIGVTVMLFVDGLLLMTRMHHEDLRKERTIRRRQKTLAAQNRRNASLLAGQNSRCQQPTCAEDTPLKSERNEKNGSAK